LKKSIELPSKKITFLTNNPTTFGPLISALDDSAQVGPINIFLARAAPLRASNVISLYRALIDAQYGERQVSTRLTGPFHDFKEGCNLPLGLIGGELRDEILESEVMDELRSHLGRCQGHQSLSPY
jgi:hypothetical protein